MQQKSPAPYEVLTDTVIGTTYCIVAYLHTDNREVTERVIGVGGSLMVIHQGEFTVKIPKLRRMVQWIDDERVIGRLTPRPGDYDERKIAIETIKNEKAICKRVQGAGVIPCHNLDSEDHCIQMKFMVNGSLRQYLAVNRPEQRTKITWLMNLAQTFAYIHNCRVVVDDIRTENILLDEHLNVKVSDFDNSILVPLDWDFQSTVEEGHSMKSDIGRFGAIIFEIATGQKCNFDLFHGWKDVGDPLRWPPRHTLPATKDVWLGDVIERCWSQGNAGFQSMIELSTTLEQVLDELKRPE